MHGLLKLFHLYSDNLSSKNFYTSLNRRDQITPLIIPFSNYLSTNYPLTEKKNPWGTIAQIFQGEKFRKYLKKWTNASRVIERGSGGTNFSGGVDGAIIKAGVADAAWRGREEEKGKKKKKQQASARMRKLRKHPAERKEIHPRSRSPAK